MPRATSAKKGLVVSGTSRPRVRLSRRRSERATWLGPEPSCAAAWRTRATTAGRTSSGRVRAREAVLGETPAARATSASPDILPSPAGSGRGGGTRGPPACDCKRLYKRLQPQGSTTGRDVSRPVFRGAGRRCAGGVAAICCPASRAGPAEGRGVRRAHRRRAPRQAGERPPQEGKAEAKGKGIPGAARAPRAHPGRPCTPAPAAPGGPGTACRGLPPPRGRSAGLCRPPCAGPARARWRRPAQAPAARGALPRARLLTAPERPCGACHGRCSRPRRHPGPSRGSDGVMKGRHSPLRQAARPAPGASGIPRRRSSTRTLKRFRARALARWHRSPGARTTQRLGARTRKRLGARARPWQRGHARALLPHPVTSMRCLEGGPSAR